MRRIPAPSASVNAPADRASGRRLSRRLARTHYENFPVASFILPRRLRQDVFTLYAFARLADDFADEPATGGDGEMRLAQWEQQLRAAAEGEAEHPLFAALGDVIRRRNLPLQLFLDLLEAFRLDLVKSRYGTWGELADYARLSANPVGRLVLMAAGCNDPDLFALSDKICTALQFANHWQDVREDFQRGRVYIPAVELQRCDVREADIAAAECSDGFKRLMHSLVMRTSELFDEGLPLIGRVPAPLSLQLALYWSGGTGALRCIRRVNYDVLNRSAKLQRGDKAAAILRALGLWLRSRIGGRLG